MSFFQSKIVQAEMKEIAELQEKIYTNVFAFSSMDRADKLKHVELLEELLKKQQVLYTRLSLSDDPEAKQMKDDLKKSIMVMGFPDGTDMPYLFEAMHKTIQTLRLAVDQ